MSEAKDLIVQGLWKNNSALVQLLDQRPRAWAGDHLGIDADQRLHFRGAPLGAE